MTGRRDVRPMVIMVALAIVFAAALYGRVTGEGPFVGATTTPVPTATSTVAPTPSGPKIAIVHDPCCAQAARFLHATWTSTEKVSAVALSLDPAPPFDCAATVDTDGLSGTFGCAGFLPAATDHVARLPFTTVTGTYPVQHAFHTMADRLTNVHWYTEFEDPTGDPIACAAASVRIVQGFTGEDTMTATQIETAAHKLNASTDPGLDPVAIATMLFLAVFLFTQYPRAWFAAGAWIAVGVVMYYGYSRHREAAFEERARWMERLERKDYRVLVAISSPKTMRTLMEAAIVLSPTGPPRYFSMTVRNTRRSISSRLRISTSKRSRASWEVWRVMMPFPRTSA